MKRNALFLGVLVCILTLGVMLVSCDDGGEKPTAWSAIESLDQLDGTWKGSGRETMPAAEFSGEEEEAEILLKGINVTVNVKITMSVDAAAKTTSRQVDGTLSFSGNIDETKWALLSMLLVLNGMEPSGSNYSATFHDVDFEEPIYEDEWQDVQIDPSGKKIKVPAGTFGAGIPAIEFTKQ
ncbi:MAG: hypothetical protein LBP42_04180 [Treponema sp.]|jgi:hypothetical protein|nr:hypothetical protein [Treponema sp.]